MKVSLIESNNDIFNIPLKSNFKGLVKKSFILIYTFCFAA